MVMLAIQPILENEQVIIPVSNRIAEHRVNTTSHLLKRRTICLHG